MSLITDSDNFSFMNHSSIYNVYTTYVHEYLYISAHVYLYTNYLHMYRVRYSIYSEVSIGCSCGLFEPLIIIEAIDVSFS